MTRVTDLRGDLQRESSGCGCSSHHLQSLCRPQNSRAACSTGYFANSVP